MTNTNEETGIPFGLISVNSLELELVDTLMYENGFNISEWEALIETVQNHTFDETVIKAGKDNLLIDLENINWAGGIGEDYILAQAIMELEEEFASEPELYQKIEHLEFDEPQIEGVYEGVYYMTCWLGGALHFWISESPIITHKAHKGSICVPGAGVIDELDGDYTCYDVPADWRRQE